MGPLCWPTAHMLFLLLAACAVKESDDISPKAAIVENYKVTELTKNQQGQWIHGHTGKEQVVTADISWTKRQTARFITTGPELQGGVLLKRTRSTSTVLLVKARTRARARARAQPRRCAAGWFMMVLIGRTVRNCSNGPVLHSSSSSPVMERSRLALCALCVCVCVLCVCK